ncbi:unnamed protein product [Ranitomeya imitator]|uniref:Reverse transcriptase domain-containing protein n=1 Tax=Ranitomeya imitator TaxID=111125 RepID=A0ABN9LQ38_9NEOB|nr:unnamed protein product [Ranitomeya imitator]
MCKKGLTSRYRRTTYLNIARTLEHLHKEIISIQEEIKNIESQLASTISADEFNALKKKIDTNVTQHRRDIELKRRTKFQRDLEDYELNRVYGWQDKSTIKKSYRQDGYRSSMDNIRFGPGETRKKSQPMSFFRQAEATRKTKRTRRGIWRTQKYGPCTSDKIAGVQSLVVNISSKSLGIAEYSALQKGLSCCPSYKNDTFQMDMDLQKFYRSLRLKLHFSETDYTVTPTTQISSPVGITAASLGLCNKSTYRPPMGSHPLETFIQFVDTSFQKLCQDTSRGTIHYSSNLSVSERQALRSLQNEKDIIVKPADKGGAIVEMDKLLYRNEVYRQLGNTTTYKKLPQNPSNLIQNTIKMTLDDFQTHSILDIKTREFLTKKHPITPVIYILPKILKNLQNPPGRPIVASTDSLLAPISIYLEKILTPLIRNTSSFLLDTGAFLETIKNINPAPPDTILVSFDVKDLYTLIPHTKGVSSTRWLLSIHNMRPNPIDFCCELLSIVLTNNFFLFEDTYCLQIKGSAMGLNMAPPYTNAYMAHHEDTLIYAHDSFRRHVIAWKRYIDDDISSAFGKVILCP